MKPNLLLLLTVLLCVSFTSNAQTAYVLKYNLQKTSDPIEYSAFFLNYEDGRAMVRVIYKSPVNGEMVRIETDLLEQYTLTKGIQTDTKIAYKPVKSRPVLPVSQNNTNFAAPVFWFKRNLTTDTQEPFGVSMSFTDPESAINTFLPEIKLVDSMDLKKKDFVLQYFTENDEFYKGLFKIKTRSLTDKEKNVRIFLLAVGNIRDKKIGTACEKDLNRIVETFDRLSRFMQIKFAPNYPRVISGDGYNLKNVQNAINELNPDSNDIVVFYFSGHGFRKKGDTRRPPWIDLRPKDDNTYNVNSLNLEGIYDIIKKKKGRFNLILADCCNEQPGTDSPLGTEPSKSKGLISNWSMNNVRTLFLNPKRTSILATASSPNELSACNIKFGGFFSHFFKVSMENYFSYFKTDVSWNKVFKDAIDQTEYKAKWTWCDAAETTPCKQRPFTIPAKLDF